MGNLWPSARVRDIARRVGGWFLLMLRLAVLFVGLIVFAVIYAPVAIMDWATMYWDR